MGSARPKGRRAQAVPPVELSCEERALQKVVRVVNLREQSTATMRRKLEQAGFEASVVDSTLQRAQQIGLIDDRRYAEALVRSTLSSGKGLRHARSQLEALGISLDEVEAYQDHVADGPSEVDRALDLLSRKRFTAKNKRQAAYRTLVGKGFSSDAASSAVRIWSEQQ